MALKFSGKKVLVTGASKSIGRGIALALANSGAKVYALARSKDLLDELAAENSNIVPVVQDLTDWDETRATLGKLEVLDGLVNNAGISLGFVPALKQSREEVETYFKGNTLPTINTIQAIGNKMIESGTKGSIVNVSSVVALAARPNMLGYSISKAAVDMATKQFALELGPYGIRVNSVNPTLVQTEIFDQVPAELMKEIKDGTVERMPLQRLAQIEDIVKPVLYLLSDDAAMVTGTTNAIDGGWMCNLTRK